MHNLKKLRKMRKVEEITYDDENKIFKIILNDKKRGKKLLNM